MVVLKALVTLMLLVLLLGAVLLVAGQLGLLAGKRPTDLGARDGQLKPVPPTPNAVSSSASDPRHRVEPFRYEGDGTVAFGRLRELVTTWPGAQVVSELPGYLHAELTTPWLRFVDDLEFLLDEDRGVIHVRSASRIGYSDLGTNRARVDAIRRRFAATP
jgi:uncharacterized protein (DUF1499 family)